MMMMIYTVQVYGLNVLKGFEIIESDCETMFSINFPKIVQPIILFCPNGENV